MHNMHKTKKIQYYVVALCEFSNDSQILVTQKILLSFIKNIF